MVKKLLTYGTPKKLFVSGSPKKLTAGEAACECCGCSCAFCDAGAPCRLEVVLSGFVDSACEDCDCFNGTFILDYSGEDEFGCHWGYALDCCEWTSIDAILSEWSPGEYQLLIDLVPLKGVGNPSWGIYPPPTDCLGWTSLSLTRYPVQADFGCIWTSATCTVSAL